MKEIYTTTTYTVYSEDAELCWDITEDADGLGLVELREKDLSSPISKQIARITLPPEIAIKVGEFLIKYANEQLTK